MKKILSNSSKAAALLVILSASSFAHADFDIAMAGEQSKPALPSTPASPGKLPAKAAAPRLASSESITALYIATPASARDTEFFKEAATPDAGDVWNRIRSGFALSTLNNPLVAQQTALLSANAQRFEGLTQRSSPFLYHLVQELQKRDMPMELALLPFVESAFNPSAVSKANAVGMWQFMPATGRDFKLTQSVFKDERRGVVASTDAALTYLQALHDEFGDWELALAAYNWGQGSVRKAIQKNQRAGKGTSFNELSHLMPAETRAYVPKLMAFKAIIETPESFGVNLAPVANKPYFTAVTESRDIDVSVAAQLAELPVKEFKALNPQFNKPVIPGGVNAQILLPQANADKFKANLAQWTHSLSSWTSHKVTAAYEKIEAVAARFKTSPALLREVNNIPPRMAIKAGSTLLVPRMEASSLSQDIEPTLVDTAALFMSPEGSKRSSKAVHKSRYKPRMTKVKG